jgi:hypothetical protein
MLSCVYDASSITGGNQEIKIGLLKFCIEQSTNNLQLLICNPYNAAWGWLCLPIKCFA